MRHPLNLTLGKFPPDADGGRVRVVVAFLEAQKGICRHAIVGRTGGCSWGVSKRQVPRETGTHWSALEKMLAQLALPGHRGPQD